MKITVTSTTHIDVGKIVGAVDNDTFWTFAAREWHRLYSPYVPMDSGTLRDQVTIEPKTITHTAPYAHYQYMGEVYGPNIPYTDGNGDIGFFSKPGVPKHPTGAKLSYHKDKNSLASSKWDKAAEPSEKSALIARLQEFVDGGELKLGG